MDRIAFVQSIKGLSVEDQIKKCFDEVMGMYNLFGDYGTMDITVGPQNYRGEARYTFDLRFNTKEEASQLQTLLEKNPFILDNYYPNERLMTVPETIIEDTTVRISIREM